MIPAAVLGPPTSRRSRTVCYGDEWPAFARWERGDDDAADAVEVTDDATAMIATRGDGDVRTWPAVDAAAVLEAAAWLGWALPRPTLPGLAPTTEAT